MKIKSLLESSTPASDPANATSTAPKFGRSDKFLEQKEETVEECTTSGSVASVASPVGGMQRRGKGSMFAGIKTSDKFPNSKAVKEGQINEVDPRNFDSDVDYYAARNAPAKPRYHGTSSPGVNQDDEAYFREIFRKKRLAAQQAERSADHERLATGTNEGVDSNEELKTWQVVIFNNYYRGKYSDYGGRYYYVLASSPEEAKQVVLDNADGILQELLAMKSHNGKKILPRGSAVRITPERIGKIADGTVEGRMSTAGFKKMFGPQGPMMVKLSGGAVQDIQDPVVQGSDLKTVSKADLGQNKLNLPSGYGDVVQPQKVGEAGGNVPSGMTWQGGKLQKRPELVAAAKGNKNYQAYLKRKAAKEKEQAVAEGVAETMSMDEAKKVLRHYGADNFKTTSNELYFYKNGQQFNVDLTLGADSVRSVSLSQLNQAARQLKGQGMAEGSDDNEPFDYEKWKASTVKPRNPRGYKEAEFIAQQQKEINRKRKEQEQGVAVDESQPVKYRATVEYGPTASDAHFVTVTANSTEEAEAKVAAWCKKKGVRNPMITINGADKPQMNEKSKSQAQFRTMAAVAHNPKFAKKVGISQKVGKEFHSADKKSNYKSLPKEVDEAEEQGVAESELLSKIREMLDDYASTVDESAAWQKKSGKNKTGGLNQKGVDSYRREHPGSKLQTAVTTKPSKLKPGSKAAKRRKSFCARMGGMKGPMKDEHGKPTRKALSLRKWNCESVEQFEQMIESHFEQVDVLAESTKQRLDPKCWSGYKKQGTKMKGDTRVNNCVKVDEAEFTEDKLAQDLYKDLQIFKKGTDKDIGSKAKDKEIGNKPTDKDIVAKEGFGDTIKKKAKQFSRYMTEPNSPHNDQVRSRAKNIDKIRKQEEKKSVFEKDPEAMREFERSGGYKAGIDVMGWQVGWAAAKHAQGDTMKEAFQKLYYGGGASFPFSQKAFKLAWVAYNKHYGPQGNLEEMDGDGVGRDGSTDAEKKEFTAKPITSQQAQDKALDTLKQVLSKPENMNVLKRLKNK